MLDGVFWIARTGSPWRDLHDHFGKWSSVYRQFRRWTLSGVWDVLLAALNESGEGQDSVQMVDSTIVRAHQHAAGAKKSGGSGRRSWPLARWLLDQDPSEKQWPGPARRRGPDGRRGFRRQRLRARSWPSRVPSRRSLLGDKGYDADAILADLEAKDIAAVIPPKRNRKVQPVIDGHSTPLRNLVERCFSKLKHSRRLATRYDKTADSYLGFVLVASIRLWVRHFVNRT